MSTDLVANISQDLIAKLGDQFNTIFSNIRIYGTIDSPLFVVRDVEKILDLGDLHIRDKPIYVEGEEYITMTVPTRGGPQKTTVLTEQGLYIALHTSNVPAAREYRRFIVVVMKQLRTQGVVTLEGALKQLQVELETVKSRAKMLDDETDRQQELIRDLNDTLDSKAGMIARLENRVATAAEDVEIADSVAAKSGNVEYIGLLERALMKSVFVHVAGIEEDEAMDLPDNEVYVFRLSTKSTLARHHQAAEFMMVNPTKQITQMGMDHECSLTDLREMVETSNMAYLKSM